MLKSVKIIARFIFCPTFVMNIKTKQNEKSILNFYQCIFNRFIYLYINCINCGAIINNRLQLTFKRYSLFNFRYFIYCFILLYIY